MNEKKSVYEMVTDRIITQLEQGVIPWQKPWRFTGNLKNLAYNRITKKPYSLLNQLILLHEGEYATYKQWESIGGCVRKGEKAEIVTFWKILPVKGEETGEMTQIPLLRKYSVFHISQVDGVEAVPVEELPKPADPIPVGEKVIHDYVDGSELRLIECVSDKAFYSVTGDYINLPMKDQYDEIEEFYCTAFHEMVHSTGHEKRLKRKELYSYSGFGSEMYSKEELTAEIGSACLMESVGIETEKCIKNSAAYIQSWLMVLQNDKRMVVSAAGKAEKAVEYILSFSS